MQSLWSTSLGILLAVLSLMGLLDSQVLLVPGRDQQLNIILQSKEKFWIKTRLNLRTRLKWQKQYAMI